MEAGNDVKRPFSLFRNNASNHLMTREVATILVVSGTAESEPNFFQASRGNENPDEAIIPVLRCTGAIEI